MKNRDPISRDGSYVKHNKDVPDDLDRVFETIRKQNRDSPEREPLNRLLGVWDVQVDFFLQGTGIRMQAYGVADGRPIVGGRYIQFAVATDYEGNSYNAMIVLCYDAIVGRYMSVLLDNTVTSLMNCQGSFDFERQLLSEEGELSNASFECRHPVRTTWDLSEEDLIDLNWEAPLGEKGQWVSILRAVMTRRPTTDYDDL